MSLERRMHDARAWAVAAHADQRYGDAPYAVHLDEVRAIADEFAVLDEDVRVATYLHDVVEDTELGREDVAAAFGERVAALVDAVSDPPDLPNRKTRKAAAYPRIRATPGATVVKLCDRLANVRASMRDNPGLLGMYRKEHPGFREALRRPDGELEPDERALWDALDALLLRD